MEFLELIYKNQDQQYGEVIFDALTKDFSMMEDEQNRAKRVVNVLR